MLLGLASGVMACKAKSETLSLICSALGGLIRFVAVAISTVYRRDKARAFGFERYQIVGAGNERAVLIDDGDVNKNNIVP